MKTVNLEKLKAKLPLYPNILGRWNYLNYAVAVPLISINSELHVLFERRSLNISQGGEICFPGGKFDPEKDSNYKDTAIRESSEELGIPVNKIVIEGCFDSLFTQTGVIVEPYLATLNINSISDLKYNRHEVEEIFTIPISFFLSKKPEEYQTLIEVKPSFTDEKGNEIILLPTKELGLPDRYSSPWGKRKRKILVYKTDNGVIWGITAEIIHELSRLLNLT